MIALRVALATENRSRGSSLTSWTFARAVLNYLNTSTHRECLPIDSYLNFCQQLIQQLGHFLDGSRSFACFDHRAAGQKTILVNHLRIAHENVANRGGNFSFFIFMFFFVFLINIFDNNDFLFQEKFFVCFTIFSFFLAFLFIFFMLSFLFIFYFLKGSFHWSRSEVRRVTVGRDTIVVEFVKLILRP